MQLTDIEYCIFDMDGLLLDTETIYSKVTTEILARYGKSYSWEIKSKMMGLRQMEAAEILIKDTGLEGILSPEDYLKERNQKQNELFPKSRPMPGVIRLIKHLKSHRIPIAVATSSHKGAFDVKTSSDENKHLFKLFDAIVTGDDKDVVKSKPAPDIFHVAAKRLGVDSSNYQNCLVFEDAPAGVQAGINAGMKVIWVPDSQLNQDQYPDCKIGATLILNSLEEFNPIDFGLPQYSDSQIN